MPILKVMNKKFLAIVAEEAEKNSIFFSPSDLITYMDSTFASHMERCLIYDNKYSTQRSKPNHEAQSIRLFPSI